MGQTRTQQPKQDSSIAEEVAWFVGGIIAGTIVVPNPTLAIAEALANLVPASLPLRADISAQVARLLLTDPPGASSGLGALSAINGENLKYRVAYGFEAMKRLAKAVAKSSDVPLEERLGKALKAEASYLEAHQSAAEKRTQVDEMIKQAIAVYGPVLSWHAVERPTSRLNHLKADKHNWNAANGAPRATGALPGTEPNCLCTWGAPIPGASLIS